MADPLSVTASIAGLVTLADLVFGRTFAYVTAVRGASKETRKLSSETGSLYGILTRLHLIASQLESNGNGSESAIQVHILHDCAQTLRKLSSKLEKYDPSIPAQRPLDSMRRKLRWPFSTPEVEDLIAEIERHKTSLSLALQADSVSTLLVSLSRQDDLHAELRDIKTELKRKREVELRVAIDDRRRKMLESLGSINPKQNHDMSLKLRQPATGLWLTEGDELKHWLATKNAKLWLFGIPGAGKTILAASVIEEALKSASPSIAVAFVYCDYKNAATQDPIQILGALAKQIAKQDEQSFEQLESFYKTRHPDGQELLPFDAEDVRDLVLRMSSFYERTMIIVDGLDECGDNTSIVVGLLASLMEAEGTTIQTVFLSRDEAEIRDFLYGYTQVSIAAQTADIELYVGAEITRRIRTKRLRIKDPSLKDYIMERLVTGAHGMFRWVACQMDHLCELSNDTARREALNDLPPDLHSTYERILRRVDGRSKDIRKLVQKTLHWLLGARTDLSVTALGEAISIDENSSVLDRNAICDETEILRWCSSLVRKSTSNANLELAHFTVKEFLSESNDSDEFAAYRLRPDERDAELGWTCLKYLTLKDFDKKAWISGNGPFFQENDFAFRPYAVSHWASHVQGHLQDRKIYSICQRLLHPSKSHIFMTWALDYHRYRPDDHDEAHLDILPAVTRATPLHYAAMFGFSEMCVWLLEEGLAPDQMSAFGSPLRCALLGTSAMNIFDAELPFAEPEDMKPTVKAILEAGADPNLGFEVAGNEESLIKISAELELEPICIQLLQKGAVIDAGAREQWCFSIEDTREILETIGKESLHERDYAFLLQFSMGTKASFTSDDNVSSNVVDFSPSLRSAAQFGQVDVVLQLLNTYNLDVNTAEDETGLTALHHAASGDHIEVMSILMRHKGDDQRVDASGRTPLHISVMENAHRCLRQLLLQSTSLSMADNVGMNIWHLAALYGNAKTFDVLSQYFAEEVHSAFLESHQGLNPIQYAARAGSVDAMSFFAEHGHDLFIETSDGSTLLHHALFSKSAETILFLLEKGLDPCKANEVGSIALHLLFAECKIIGPKVAHIVDILLDKGADPCATRRDGTTALQLLFEATPSKRFYAFEARAVVEAGERGIMAKPRQEFSAQ